MGSIYGRNSLEDRKENMKESKGNLNMIKSVYIMKKNIVSFGNK